MDTQDVKQESATVAAVKDFVAGYLSGFFSKIIEYPLDTVKVLQQTQEGQYTSAYDCLRTTIRSKGFMSLYEGLPAPLVGAMAENATLFGAYGAAKDVLGLRDVPLDEAPMWKLLACGGFSGFCAAFVLTPAELVKCKLQVQQGADASFQGAITKYKGPIDCVRQVVRAEGIQGLFRGNVATIARELPGNVAWFGTYEIVCKALLKPGQRKKDLSSMSVMFAGACSGAAYWSAFFPADTVKSRMQTDPRVASRSFVDVMGIMYKESGLRGLYRGWGITVARAAPSNAFIFLVYEKVSKFLKKI